MRTGSRGLLMTGLVRKSAHSPPVVGPASQSHSTPVRKPSGGLMIGRQPKSWAMNAYARVPVHFSVETEWYCTTRRKSGDFDWTV